jgi:integrase
VDVRKLLDGVAVRAGLAKGAIRTRAFRHTYCAARLQTLDQSAPVSTYTVARELGHEPEAMVRRCTRTSEPFGTGPRYEYRVEQHLERLGDRLQRRGFQRASGSGKDTAGWHSLNDEAPQSRK